MIDHLLRDLQVLRKADMLIGKIWLNVLARRLGLFVFAALIGVFGLGMANVAGYNALQDPLGTVWAASVMAVVDFAIAVIVLLLAVRSRPGPEIDVAQELRKTALDQLHEDARDLKLTIDAMGQEIRNVKQNVTALVHNPLDVAAEKLLVPAALSVLRGLRSKKEHSSQRWSDVVGRSFFLKRQARRPHYLEPGDRISAQIRSRDGTIDLGEQATKIVGR